MGRSWKYFFYFSLICLIGFFAAHTSSAADNEPGYLNLKYPTLIEAIYEHRPEHRFWQEESLRDELEKQIALFALADISDNIFYSYLALKKADQQNNWQHYERLASDLFLFYLSYTEQLPRKGGGWLFGGGIKNNIGAPSNSAIDAFFNASSYQAQFEYLQSLAPRTSQFTHLYQNLLKLYLNPNGPTARFTASAKEGKPLEQKELLLSRLQISGDISAEIKRDIESEDEQLYSRKLREIIISFQKRHGLKADGIIGKNTRYWLNLSHQKRLKLMALNMLRIQFWTARLWAVNKPRFVSVNIPDFTMEYWEFDEKVFESKVIVGRRSRKTPLFAAKLDSIVFNPAWNVPNSIMRKDIIPEALADKDYLEQHQYEILTHWQSKNAIDPEQIDWSSITADNFPYKLRQKPGKNNALGLYKFNTPNRHTIFLHDTPAKHLFENQNRAYSSGCIRVQKAKQFAQLLMNKSGFSYQDYKNHHYQQKTSAVSLKRIIPVYAIYQTVWVDRWGETQFRKDIYNYDNLNKRKNFSKNFYLLLQEKKPTVQ